MHIVITRHRKTSETIDGRLTIDGLRICDTAENVNGALPAGKHPISVIKCKQYARKMLLLNPNPPCDKCPTMEYCGNNSTLPCYCPMIKPGNGVYNRKDGSIIVGTYLVPGCLTHPKEAFEAIYDRLRKSVERQKQREQKRACSHSAESRPGVGDSQRGHDIILEIIEDYPKLPAPLTNYQLGCQILKQF